VTRVLVLGAKGQLGSELCRWLGVNGGANPRINGGEIKWGTF
jgi:dTDP-4-dehydrorhamnose reductase